MQIRAEQMTVFETAAEDNFARRIARHLLENYAQAVVRLPDIEPTTVNELSSENLDSLVKVSVERARRYGLTHESSISAFSAIMFEVAPNFDSHRLSQMMLKDETIEPDARLDELLEVLTEKNWETIRADYDVKAWQSNAEETIKPEDAEQPAAVENSDFAKTVMNAGNAPESKKPTAIDDITFDGTIGNFDGAQKSAKIGEDKNPDLLDTVLNINVSKE